MMLISHCPHCGKNIPFEVTCIGSGSGGSGVPINYSELPILTTTNNEEDVMPLILEAMKRKKTKRFSWIKKLWHRMID